MNLVGKTSIKHYIYKNIPNISQTYGSARLQSQVLPGKISELEHVQVFQH